MGLSSKFWFKGDLNWIDLSNSRSWVSAFVVESGATHFYPVSGAQYFLVFRIRIRIGISPIHLINQLQSNDIAIRNIRKKKKKKN